MDDPLRHEAARRRSESEGVVVGALAGIEGVRPVADPPEPAARGDGDNRVRVEPRPEARRDSGAVRKDEVGGLRRGRGNDRVGMSNRRQDGR